MVWKGPAGSQDGGVQLLCRSRRGGESRGPKGAPAPPGGLLEQLPPLWTSLRPAASGHSGPQLQDLEAWGGHPLEAQGGHFFREAFLDLHSYPLNWEHFARPSKLKQKYETDHGDLFSEKSVPLHGSEWKPLRAGPPTTTSEYMWVLHSHEPRGQGQNSPRAQVQTSLHAMNVRWVPSPRPHRGPSARAWPVSGTMTVNHRSHGVRPILQPPQSQT